MFIARHARQDLWKLRGLDRPFTRLEKLVIAECLNEMMHDEVQPIPELGVKGTDD